MASTKIEDLTHDTQERVAMLVDLAAKEGIGIHPISTKRSCAEQQAIYAQGRTAPGTIITHANGCQSWHVWGRAIDLMAVRDGKIVSNGNDPVYDWLGELAESIGMRWGGRFSWGRDAVHFEYHPGVTVSQVCSDPAQCEGALKLPWPGPDVPPEQVPPPSPPGGQADPVYYQPKLPEQTSGVLMVLAAGAAVGAGYLAVSAYKALRRQGITG